jgi:hypothetical protein
MSLPAGLGLDEVAEFLQRLDVLGHHRVQFDRRVDPVAIGIHALNGGGRVAFVENPFNVDGNRLALVIQNHVGAHVRPDVRMGLHGCGGQQGCCCAGECDGESPGVFVRHARSVRLAHTCLMSESDNSTKRANP